MRFWINTDEKYGERGPFEADSKDELIEAMMPTIEKWADELWDRHCIACMDADEPYGSEAKFFDHAITELTEGYRSALQLWMEE